MINVDHAERQAALLSLLQECDAFDVKLMRLQVGDYLIDDEILIERKTTEDFSTSLIDGRLFRQAYRLAHCRWRPVLIIEGQEVGRGPDVHPHAIQGAILALTVRWQLPVIHTDGPEESLRVIRFLARQACGSRPLLRRYGRKPKRLVSRRTFFLQGLPGIGPELARRLLHQLGSVERIITADVEHLSRVPGLGPKKAEGIRDLVSEGPTAPRTTRAS